jgi:hypothetical protein
MSKQEFSRLDVLLRVQSGRLRVTDACVLIGLQRRQVFRLVRGLKQDGATSLLSKRRGRTGMKIRVCPSATSSAFIITRAMRPLPSMNGCTSATRNIMNRARANGSARAWYMLRCVIKYRKIVVILSR